MDTGVTTNLLSDRELLELAAKAHGSIKFYNDFLRDMARGGYEWNPLANDGDSFRLASRLKISTAIKQDAIHGEYVEVTALGKGFHDAHIEWFDKHDTETAAIRRAIVCAAANLGISKL